MTKTRRVLVLSPRDRVHRARTFIVVPLSLTTPRDPKPWHYQLQDQYPFLSRTEPVWVKGDMIGHVSAGRLQAFRQRNIAVQRLLTAHDLVGAQKAVAAAIGARTRTA